VRLFRPWSEKHFLEVLPKTIRKLAVIERTLESGSSGNPLYLDCIQTLAKHGLRHISVIGGTFGLASKAFTPESVIAVYENLFSNNPKQCFTVGINDDVTHTSLDIKPLKKRLIPEEIK